MDITLGHTYRWHATTELKGHNNINLVNTISVLHPGQYIFPAIYSAILKNKYVVFLLLIYLSVNK